MSSDTLNGSESTQSYSIAQTKSASSTDDEILEKLLAIQKKKATSDEWDIPTISEIRFVNENDSNDLDDR